MSHLKKLSILIFVCLLTTGCFSKIKEKLDGSGKSPSEQKTDTVSPSSQSQQQNGSSNTVVSADNKISLILPDGWKARTGLNDKADIQASDPQRDSYVIILSEYKADLQDMNIDKHSELTRTKLLSQATNIESEGPFKVTVNGNPAIQFKISATVNQTNVTYLHTTIESPKYFHQMITWTTRTRFDEMRPVFDKVVEGIREK